LPPNSATCRFNAAQLHVEFRLVGVSQHGDGGGFGSELVQKTQLLGGQIGLSEDHASRIATRPIETGDQPGSDRIETHSEDDRNRGACRFYTQCCNSVRNDHSRPSADEFCRHPWNPIMLIVGPAILDSDVLALDESGLVQALSERTDKRLGAGRRRGAKETDHRHRRLLRLRNERPRGRAAEKRDEIAPLHLCAHSITSSAP
jgi:hypothetical protein